MRERVRSWNEERLDIAGKRSAGKCQLGRIPSGVLNSEFLTESISDGTRIEK